MSTKSNESSTIELDKLPLTIPTDVLCEESRSRRLGKLSHCFFLDPTNMDLENVVKAAFPNGKHRKCIKQLTTSLVGEFLGKVWPHVGCS